MFAENPAIIVLISSLLLRPATAKALFPAPVLQRHWGRREGVVVALEEDTFAATLIKTTPTKARSGAGASKSAGAGVGVNLGIPRVVHQSWRSPLVELPQPLQALRRAHMRMNPSWTFKYYDDAQVAAYVQAHASPPLRRAFHRISPAFGAARSDVFRYLVLFTEGGVWLDVKSALRRPLDGWVRPGTAASRCVLDKPRTSLEDYRAALQLPTHEQWVLAFAAHHVYLDFVLARIVRDVQSYCGAERPALLTVAEAGARSRQQSLRQLNLRTPAKELVLRLTGPDALAVAIHDAIIRYGKQHHEVDIFQVASWRGSKLDLQRFYNGSHYSTKRDELVVCEG